MVIRFQSLFQWKFFFGHNQSTPQLKSSNLNLVPRAKKRNLKEILIVPNAKLTRFGWFLDADSHELS
jgi:hypothetical protein